MSTRCRSACLALALGLTVGAPQAALAKPPGPAGEGTFAPAPLDAFTPCVFFAQRQCRAAAQQAEKKPVAPASPQTGRLLLGLGVQSGGRLIVHVEQQDPGQNQPRFRITLPLAAVPIGFSSVLNVAPVVECPYLRKQSPANPDHRTEMGPDGVLANLEKLTTARELYRLAEYYRRLGRRETAAVYYQQAHLVCPSCRYGLQAMDRLSQLDAARAETAAEEQEMPDAAAFDWGEVIRMLGCCADVEFGSTTRFQCEVPVGAVRIRVEYNAQRDGRSGVRIRVPGTGGFGTSMVPSGR